MENKKELLKALSEFQKEVPVIHKNTDGYGYKYADLSAIFAVIKPLMYSHGLGFTQLLDGESLETVIFHVETGQSIESSVHIKQDVQLAKMNAFQVMGSAITYYRRYALSASLGLITDDDKDACGEQVKKVKSEPVKSKEVDTAINILSMCKTLDNLKKMYLSLDKPIQADKRVIAHKDKIKNDLKRCQTITNHPK